MSPTFTHLLPYLLLVPPPAIAGLIFIYRAYGYWQHRKGNPKFSDINRLRRLHTIGWAVYIGLQTLGLLILWLIMKLT